MDDLVIQATSYSSVCPPLFLHGLAEASLCTISGYKYNPKL